MKCLWIILVVVQLLGSSWMKLPSSASELSVDEQIGQLFVIPIGEEFLEKHRQEVEHLIQEHKVGGILLKQGTVEGQKELVQKLQELSDVPLLCFQDAEWGVGMRLRDVKSLPKNLTLGAVQDLALIYRVGQEIGSQCRETKTDLNLAPVVDVNTNPSNPIIYMRSFGDDPVAVAERSLQIHLGMQSVGVLTCAKHFPGHGSVSIDSHCALPIVDLSKEELVKIELLPFESLIESGVDAVLSAHVAIPALIEEPLLPVTFSKTIIHNLLRHQLKFEGLVITDALNMKAIADRYLFGEIALRALMAGHDLLLYGDHIAPNIEEILFHQLPEGMKAVKQGVAEGLVSEKEIEEHVQRILDTKKRVQDYSLQPYPRSEASLLKRKVFQEAMTLIKNEGMLPLMESNVALIECGHVGLFSKYLEEHMPIERFSSAVQVEAASLQEFDCVVLAISAPFHQLPLERQALIEELFNQGAPVVCVIFGSPYFASDFEQAKACLVAYENDPDAQCAAADVLLGRSSPKGKLPVSVLPHFHNGDGLSW